ncbi:MAG: imelysin family protein [Pseudomonadota bacterium]
MAHHFASRLILASLACITLSGCDRPPEPEPQVPAFSPGSADEAQIGSQVDVLVRRQLDHVGVTNAGLRRAAEAFLAAPDAENRLLLQTAWREAHLAFASLRVLPPFGADVELLFEVDAWPMEPGFLDSLDGYPESGIVNDPTLTIDAATIAGQHGITDPGEVSLGYHPLEYYAFVRPVTDFVSNPGGDDPELDETVMRRRQLFSLVTEALTDRIANLAIPGNAGREEPTTLLETILRTTRMAAQEGFQQAALIVDADRGHAEFSQTSRETLAAQVQTLRVLLAPETPLAGVLQDLSPSTAADLQETLARAEQALTEENPAEQELARLPLMMSAISHQLEEFSRLLQYPTAAP